MKPPIGVHLRASACPFRAIYLEEKIKGLFSVKRKEFFATWIEPLVRGKTLKNYVEQRMLLFRSVKYQQVLDA